jgi:hypothetical protein
VTPVDPRQALRPTAARSVAGTRAMWVVLLQETVSAGFVLALRRDLPTVAEAYCG